MKTNTCNQWWGSEPKMKKTNEIIMRWIITTVTNKKTCVCILINVNRVIGIFSVVVLHTYTHRRTRSLVESSYIPQRQPHGIYARFVCIRGVVCVMCVFFCMSPVDGSCILYMQEFAFQRLYVLIVLLQIINAMHTLSVLLFNECKWTCIYESKLRPSDLTNDFVVLHFDRKRTKKFHTHLNDECRIMGKRAHERRQRTFRLKENTFSNWLLWIWWLVKKIRSCILFSFALWCMLNVCASALNFNARWIFIWMNKQKNIVCSSLSLSRSHCEMKIGCSVYIWFCWIFDQIHKLKYVENLIKKVICQRSFLNFNFNNLRKSRDSNHHFIVFVRFVSSLFYFLSISSIKAWTKVVVIVQ